VRSPTNIVFPLKVGKNDFSFLMRLCVTKTGPLHGREENEHSSCKMWLIEKFNYGFKNKQKNNSEEIRLNKNWKTGLQKFSIF
jgi:hypothetical protein